jgi:hypothetical protein
MCDWSQAGMIVTLVNGGPWFATLPPEEWPEDQQIVDMINQDFDSDPLVGDRRQEIVFIGQFDADSKRKLLETLDSCLVTEQEWKHGNKHGWGDLEDPFELWEGMDDKVEQ